MTWNDLTEESQLGEIKAQSATQPVIIFKHSTRCSISAMAKTRLERAVAPESVAFYYLDLIRHRSISNKVEEVFGVHHESPQILLIRNGACVYDESHGGITMEDITAQAAA